MVKGVSICFDGDDDVELLKEAVTVSELVKLFSALPQDLEVSAYFKCYIDTAENIVFIGDSRCEELLNIIMDCPLCKCNIYMEKETTH